MVRSKKSKAERVAKKIEGYTGLPGLGRLSDESLGYLNDECVDVDNEYGAVRWTFADGSVITAVDNDWDLGYPDCYCHQTDGHSRCTKDGHPASQCYADASTVIE
jgi:hypothetical protein